VIRRRQRGHSLERVLGTPALFATAYGNVGSSIYYALGLVAGIALGLTPLVFVVAGIIFAATAATYTEGTVRYPEAGGSSSFARHAFNELVSFEAAWTQILTYVVTISTSAFFVPHYLSIFWAPLRQNPWDVIGGAVVIVLLVGLNIVGVQEAAKLSVVLAVIDFATQVLLVGLGFYLAFHPHILTQSVHWGVAPTWSHLALAVPIAMLAYTGIETVSNLAEETREPRKSVPAAIRLVAIAVFAIYFTLPMIALSAMPVHLVDGHYQTKLGLPPEQGGFANDPILGLVENLGIHGLALGVLKVYVGILAATILIIATNAGIIGASRITYSMANYRQLPSALRRLHPRFKTPVLTLVIFACVIPILTLLPGKTSFLGALYSFGATLSFTVAHAAIIRLRIKRSAEEAEGVSASAAYKARPNLRLGGIDWPLFAIFGLLGTGASWLVIVWQNQEQSRWAGLGWMAIGLLFYALYRRRLGHTLIETVRAPALILGPKHALEYHKLVVPVTRSAESEEAIVAASRLAASQGAQVVLVHVLEVPYELPLDADLPEEEAVAEQLLDEAEDLAARYGARAVTRLRRARVAYTAIADEARLREADLIVIGGRVRPHAMAGGSAFGRTVSALVKSSPCRVMVTRENSSATSHGVEHAWA
jgi:APA family basic amino acid/polyamine antiporter